MFSNYIIISIIIIIIIVFIFLKIQKADFTNNTEPFNTSTTSITPKEYYSLILYGTQAQYIYDGSKSIRPQLVLNFTNYWRTSPTYNENTNNSIKLYPGIGGSDNDGYIDGLNINKTYKLEIFYLISNYNIGFTGAWQLIVCPLISKPATNAAMSTVNLDFTRAISSIVYNSEDLFQYTFNINSYITGWGAFTLFLQNKRGGSVALNNLINTNITISLLEI